jgi:hypothetical protein
LTLSQFWTAARCCSASAVRSAAPRAAAPWPQAPALCNIRAVDEVAVRALSLVFSYFSFAMPFKRVCTPEALPTLAPSLFPYVTAVCAFGAPVPPICGPFFLPFWCLPRAFCFPPFPFSSSGPSPPPSTCIRPLFLFLRQKSCPVLLSPLSLSPANFTPTLSLFPPLKILMCCRSCLRRSRPSYLSFILFFFLCGAVLRSASPLPISGSSPFLFSSLLLCSLLGFCACVALVGKRKAQHAPPSCTARGHSAIHPEYNTDRGGGRGEKCVLTWVRG